MKKLMLLAVAACLIFAACGNNGGNTKGNEDNKDNKEVVEPKVEVVIPDNFTEYDCSGLTISYPNDLKVTWDGDEMVNLSNDEGSVFIDASFTSWGDREIRLEETVKNFIGLFENQGWKAVSGPEVNGCVGTALLKNDEEINNFFIVSNGKDHTVSGSVKYNQEMAEVYDAYVTPIIYSIKVK